MIFERALYNQWADSIGNHLGDEVHIDRVGVVGGGSINEARKITTAQGIFFAKLNNADAYPAMFEKEASGLHFLKQHSDFDIPKVVGVGVSDNTQWIVMEFVHGGTRGANYWQQFGHRLAEMHQRAGDQFGLEENNYIGSLSQSNSRSEVWTDFFASERLEPQLKLAKENGLLTAEMSKYFDKLFAKLHRFFPDEPPAPLHGDMWTGNFMTKADGEATIFDPAVYYGHRYMDIGMSKLFGGFDQHFYDAYREVYPMDPYWKEGIMVANLYPLLVHANLFGGGYAAQVIQTLRELL